MTAQPTVAATGPTPLPAGVEVRYQLTTLSDWHAGTGAGRPGDVDRLVARDDDELPYLPAKTVTGLWRDGCEIAARALDGGSGRVADDDPEGGPEGGPGDRTVAERAPADRAEAGGAWSRLVELVFGGQPALGPPGGEGPTGRPEPAALSIRAARLGRDLRAALARAERVAQAVTFVKPGVRIDPRSGRADDRMLRFEEQARAGIELTGVLTLGAASGPRLPAPQAEEFHRYATALLLAGARLVEQVGGKRRRGNGRCALTIPGQDLDAWWSWLAAAPPPPVGRWTAPTGLPHGRPLFGAAPGIAEETGWEVAELTLTLVDPVLAAGRLVGNQLSGADQIPGSTLLPKVLSLLGAPAQTAMLAGRLLVTAATPVVGEQRSLPAPRILARVKTDTGSGARVVNRALCRTPPVDADGEREQLKRIAGFVRPAVGPPELVGPSELVGLSELSDGGEPSLAHPRLTSQVRTHNSVDDASQRPTSTTGGGLFTYEVLAAGTVLRAQVRAREGALEAGWARRLAGEWTLGRSRKDDYGRVSVAVRPLPKPAPADRAGAAGGRRLLVWLVSDVVLLDERLRASTRPDLLRAAVAHGLGLAARDLRETAPRRVRPPGGGPDDEFWLVPTELAAGRTESWHTRWGLPRPTICAFGAGGVASYDLAPHARLEPAALVELETGGIGERRGEGFGQVQVAVLPADEGTDADANHGVEADGPDVLTTEVLRAAEWGTGPLVPPSGGDGGGGDEGSPAPLDAAERELYELLCEEAWRSEIARRAAAVVADHDRHSGILGFDLCDRDRDRDSPSSSQLALLRDLLPHLVAPGVGVAEPDNTSAVAVMFDEIVDEARRRAWPKTAGEVTRKLLTEPGRVWALLDWADMAEDTGLGLPEAEGRALVDALRSRLWPEAVSALVLAALSARRRS